MSQATTLPIGREAIDEKGWWLAHRFLILRRLTQAFFLGLFLLGPWFGIWWVKGNLTGSLTFDILPLTDPFVLLQGMVALHWPEMTAITGALIVGRGLRPDRWTRLLQLGLPDQPRDRCRPLAARPPRLGQRLAAQTRHAILGYGHGAGGLCPDRHDRVGVRKPDLHAASWPDLRNGLCLDLCPCGLPVRYCRITTRLVRTSLPGWRVLWPAWPRLDLACQRCETRRLRRLYGLLCGLPRNARYHPRASRRGRGHADHLVARLHQLRSLHRCLCARCFQIHHPVR